jgi:hypothetical protein
MASAPHPELATLIDDVLTRARADMGIANDKDFGRAIGASNAAIHFWRHGKVGKSANILIPLILRYYQTTPVRTPVKYRRRRKAVEL